MQYGRASFSGREFLLRKPTSLNSSFTVNALQLRGRVTGVDGRKFTSDIGKRRMKIDTIELFYNPLDDEACQKIKVGDYVQVTGKLTSIDMKKADIMAETVTTLIKDKNKKTNDEYSSFSNSGTL